MPWGRVRGGMGFPFQHLIADCARSVHHLCLFLGMSHVGTGIFTLLPHRTLHMTAATLAGDEIRCGVSRCYGVNVKGIATVRSTPIRLTTCTESTASATPRLCSRSRVFRPIFTTVELVAMLGSMISS